MLQFASNIFVTKHCSYLFLGGDKTFMSSSSSPKSMDGANSSSSKDSNGCMCESVMVIFCCCCCCCCCCCVLAIDFLPVKDVGWVGMWGVAKVCVIRWWLGRETGRDAVVPLDKPLGCEEPWLGLPNHVQFTVTMT